MWWDTSHSWHGGHGHGTGLGWQTLICCVVERNDNGMENVAREVWLVAPGFGE